MKAIKDCKWTVSLFENRGDIFWEAVSKDNGTIGLVMAGWHRRKSTVKKHWERFAKLNNISNWRYEK